MSGAVGGLGLVAVGHGAGQHAAAPAHGHGLLEAERRHVVRSVRHRRRKRLVVRDERLVAQVLAVEAHPVRQVVGRVVCRVGLDLRTSLVITNT